MTILAQNYLAKALTLARSLARHEPDARLGVVLIDCESAADLPAVESFDNVDLYPTDSFGVSHAQIRQMVASYNLVEFATAIKPMVLKTALDRAEQAVYLDPDTFVVAPMTELPVDLAASPGGIMLTPHFMEPTAGTDSILSEGHLLTVGYYNLGFCAVDQRARAFLDWWWEHLQSECRWDPLSGLFVDQKWVDIGAPLFAGMAWQHYGYNVGITNLHERPLRAGPNGITLGKYDHPLRLFHFHEVDTSRPEELSTRLDESSQHLRSANPAVDQLATEYITELAANEKLLPPAPAYCYKFDSEGNRLSRHVRRAFRTAVLAGTVPPDPFDPAQRTAFNQWRRHQIKPISKEIAVDMAKSLRLIFPEEYERLKDRFPALTTGLRARFVRGGGIWRKSDN